MKKSTVAGVVLMAGFGALGAGAFKKTLTPYVSVPQARAAHSPVQVYGAINQAALKFNADAGEMRFPLTDLQHNTMVVHYRGIRPGNMAQATHCVATGEWSGDHFEASSLLIKCPSKYQGEGKDGVKA